MRVCCVVRCSQALLFGDTGLAYEKLLIAVLILLGYCVLVNWGVWLGKMVTLCAFLPRCRRAWNAYHLTPRCVHDRLVQGNGARGPKHVLSQAGTCMTIGKSPFRRVSFLRRVVVVLLQRRSSPHGRQHQPHHGLGGTARHRLLVGPAHGGPPCARVPQQWSVLHPRHRHVGRVVRLWQLLRFGLGVCCQRHVEAGGLCEAGVALGVSGGGRPGAGGVRPAPGLVPVQFVGGVGVNRYVCRCLLPHCPCLCPPLRQHTLCGIHSCGSHTLTRGARCRRCDGWCCCLLLCLLFCLLVVVVCLFVCLFACCGWSGSQTKPPSAAS